MRPRFLVLVVLLVVLGSPLYAWWQVADQEAQSKYYQGATTTAMAEAQKALDAGEQATARFYLLAIADLCVPNAAAGFDPKVPAEMVTAYKALIPKAWPEGTAPSEADFTATVKAYNEKLTKAYLRASDIATSIDTYTVKQILENFGKGASRHPAALAMAIEFSGKSLPPEAYEKYCFGGDQGQGALYIQKALADIFYGPETIRQVSREIVVPDALEGATTDLGRIDANEDDWMMLRMQAKMVEDDYLNFLHWADPENAQLKELQAQVDALKEKARQINLAQVKENRVPPDKYFGGDKDALKEAMAKLFFYEQPHTILRVTVTSPNWVEEAHVWSGINAIDVGWYKLIDGAVVMKLTGDGTCWVHPVTFGRRWTGEGDNYGELMVYGWADNYQILPEWANK